MSDESKMDESALFDIATMGKSHKQKIRCQLACAYVSRYKREGRFPEKWHVDLDTLYHWVMKDE